MRTKKMIIRLNEGTSLLSNNIVNISEKEFTAQVVELAGYCGWKVYHSWLSLHSPRGFPDLTLVRENADGTATLRFLELKSERGKLTEAQTEWLTILNKVPGVWARCFRPSNWENIVLLLRRLK